MEDVKKQLDEAYALATKKSYDKAFAICDAVIQSHPSPPDGLRKRAAIYAHKDDLALAIADMTKAIEQEPGEPGDHFFRGWWYLDKGDAARAVKDLTKTLELGEEKNNHYHDQSAHFFRAAALLRLKRYDESLADCQHVQDDFLIYIKSGKISKADIVREATAGKVKSKPA
jgi:tetratricopeptide (TPR) repeat protein